jgi:methylated-DNA-[protein]-cysteine S-methyltransferase
MKADCTDVFRTRLGWMGAARTKKGLCFLVLPREERREVEKVLAESCGKVGRRRTWRELRRQVKEYLAGARRTFDLPLDLPPAAPFTEAVRTAVRDIPYGATARYGDVARRAGSPRAARAVGSAMTRNPVPLVIPCHRVVAAGGPGGFTPSPELKRRLLAIENGEAG